MDDSFFTLYQKLDREGPGEPADVEWVAGLIGLRQDASICDAGCGSGAHVPDLLNAAPRGSIVAVDAHAPFIEELRARVDYDPRVAARAGDMAEIEGPFDLIWSAGALYFLGVTEGLQCWRSALAPGGVVAFSEPCWFTETPGSAALAFWEEYPAITDAAGIDARVQAAGFKTIATRRISDGAWARYYSSLQARIEALSPASDPALAAVLEASQAEIDGWLQAKADSGYLLSVVRPG